MEKITILIYFTVLSVLVTVNSTIDISSYTYFTGLLHICHNYTRGNLSLCTSDFYIYVIIILVVILVFVPVI